MPESSEDKPPFPVPPWLEREREQWQEVVNDWANAYAEQGRELDALKNKPSFWAQLMARATFQPLPGHPDF